MKKSELLMHENQCYTNCYGFLGFFNEYIQSISVTCISPYFNITTFLFYILSLIDSHHEN